MKNKNSLCNFHKGNYTKIISQGIEFLTNKTKFAITFLFITALLMPAIAYQKVYAQTTDLQKDFLSSQIKPGDVDFEFLRMPAFISKTQLITSQKEVRVIYLVPSDKNVRDDYKAALADAALQIQDFYRKELNGFTFSLHSPVVEVYQTPNPSSWYATNSVQGADRSLWFYRNLINDGFRLSGGNFNDPNNRWIYFIDADAACDQISVAGISGIAFHGATVLRGLTVQAGLDPCPDGQPEAGRRDRTIGGIAHEMGHAFGLPHPPGCGGAGLYQGCTGGAFAQNSLMWVGYFYYPNTYFLPEDKQTLLNSGFFSQASSCTFSLGATSQNFASAGGSDSTTVNTANGCSWSAQSNNSWITVTAGATGSGGGTVSYSVAANSGPARAGTITIAGQTFTVTQANGCSFSIFPSSFEVGKSAGTGSFTINSGAGCSWTAASNVSWITITAGATGSGSGTVNFSYTANTGPLRTGTITAGGQTYTLVQASGIAIATRTTFDFDGDKRADVSVFRPDTGMWYLLNSQTGFNSAQFGLSTDKIVPADFDGDGKTDIAVWREDAANPNRAYFYILNSSNNTVQVQQFGRTGDSVSAVADWDGDGKADIAVYRSGTNGGQSYFFYRPSSQPSVDFISIPWGSDGDKPVVADYDGDGRADAAVYRPSNGVWYLLQSTKGFSAIQFGNSTDKPVTGDYDGDGKADIAVYRPSGGYWYQLRSTQGFAAVQFGNSTDLPVPADYDGDGKSDVAVFRPTGGNWYQLRSTLGFNAVQFGANGDKPTPNAFVP